MPEARHELSKAKKKEGGHPARLVRCRGLEARTPFPVCNTGPCHNVDRARCAILFRTIDNDPGEDRDDCDSTTARAVVAASRTMSLPAEHSINSA